MDGKLFRRILLAFSISVILTIILLSSIISLFAYQNAIERYENETRITVNMFSQNMRSYIDNCVSAARSVYSNSSLLSLLSKQRDVLPNQEERNSILQYLKTVHYACSSAIQIYIACPNLHQSYLYDPSVMMLTYRGIDVNGDNSPEFSSYLDINIEPTHSIVNYGHKTLYFNQRQGKQVLTIWLPIYDLPKNSSPVARLAIDLPVDFLLNNSTLTANPKEQIIVSTQDGHIIAATDSQWIVEDSSLLLTPSAAQTLQQQNYAISDNNLVVSYDIELQYCNWRIYKFVPIRQVFDKTWNTIISCMILFIVLLVLLFLMNSQHIHHQLFPLQRITSYMQIATHNQSWEELGSLADYMQYEEHDEIQKLIETFDWMAEAMKNFRIKQYELELAYDRSTYKMLQAQINPHFIYNVMQCFATNALRHQDVEQYRMLSTFGQMMHYAMVLDPYMVTLRQELEYVDSYVNLQRMRFSSQDKMVWNASPKALRLSVPKMCLQPLVENSIVHGKLFHEPGSRLEISAECNNDWLLIAVRDNGEFVSPETQLHLKEKFDRLRERVQRHEIANEKEYYQKASTGLKENGHSGLIGLENVYNRLLLLFSDVKMNIYGNDWGGTTVELQLCLTSMKGESSHDCSDC